VSDFTEERRTATRYPMVLAAQVLELPRGAKLNARTADISRTGCYVDTLHPTPVGTKVLLRITHFNEVFQAAGPVIYTSPCLGMGVAFSEIAPEEVSKLDRWLANPEGDY
jgi:Ribonuclease G/E